VALKVPVTLIYLMTFAVLRFFYSAIFNFQDTFLTSITLAEEKTHEQLL